MNNQNGISDENVQVTTVDEVVENTVPEMENSVNTPHDFSKIQELVDQLESKIQQIRGQGPSLELASVYQKSVQDGSKRQVVAGELYVGKNPTLAKFVEKSRKSVVQKVKNSLNDTVTFNQENFVGEPAFEKKDNIIRTDRFGEDKFPLTELDEVELEEPKSSLPDLSQTAQIAISRPPLKPESIFDDEPIIGEEKELAETIGEGESQAELYQNRGRAV